ncbi:MAG TPA: leishmanolysin-related zinc metalloendopeptidase [Longimicrobium sp.]|nr:leishmanolysin-related zinc metalloendopeptidase [Longimicrobium sp.]
MRKLLIASAAALLAGGCSDGTQASVATQMAMRPTSVTMDAVGATRVVRAVVLDQHGEEMPGAQIQWASEGVTVTGLGGDSARITSVRAGTSTYTATSGSASGTGTVEVTQTLVTASRMGEVAPTTVAGTAIPVRVLLQDRLGAPVPGLSVEFTVRDGGGSLSAPTAVSDANGVAAVMWTVGKQVREFQHVSAFVAVGKTVEFGATLVAGPAARATEWGGDGQTVARGRALPYMPRIYVGDAHGNAVEGVAVRFAVTSGGGRVTGAEQTTDSTGMAQAESWTLGTTVGANTLTATFPGTPVPPVVLTAHAAVPGTVTVTAGDGQAAMAGTAVPVVPTVVVRDSAGGPLAGMTVTFTASEGGGSVGTASATTNASGVASAGRWVLGPAGGTNGLTVKVQNLTGDGSYLRAIGCSGGGAGFAMTLCFTTGASDSQRAVFVNAAARWSEIIRGDVPDATGSIPAEACDEGMPSADFVYDDLVIFASIRSIDGPGGVLGAAGPCFFRAGSNLPFIGVMIFDKADVATLEREGQLGSVILHEMGHVLGIGTIWSQLGLLKNPSTFTSRLDTYFSGANAIAGFNQIGGTTYTGGQKVPVENGGPVGTINGHWRESVLQNELMTGYVNAGSNPLSAVTVRSLADLGYTVDPAAADAFSLALSLNGAAGARLRLHNDIYTGPRWVMDRAGRRTRIR